MWKFICLMAALAILPSCAWFDQPEDEAENDMIIAVDFQNVHLCSRISPEIVVTGQPSNTNYYDVRLLEYGKIDRLLGGGTWREDGSGVIPEGALTQHYIGPCPPGTQVVKFGYVVSAMQDGNPQPLEVRIYQFTPEN